MKALILAGGRGTRLWPLSRKNFPKQFLKLYNNKSLLQETFLRMREIVPLEKDPGFGLYCLITDKESQLPISGATIHITDLTNNNVVVDLKTPEDGSFKKPLPEARMNDELHYEIKIHCEGYLEKVGKTHDRAGKGCAKDK